MNEHQPGLLSVKRRLRVTLSESMSPADVSMWDHRTLVKLWSQNLSIGRDFNGIQPVFCIWCWQLLPWVSIWIVAHSGPSRCRCRHCLVISPLSISMESLSRQGLQLKLTPAIKKKALGNTRVLPRGIPSLNSRPSFLSSPELLLLCWGTERMSPSQGSKANVRPRAILLSVSQPFTFPVSIHSPSFFKRLSRVPFTELHKRCTVQFN